MWKTRMQIWSLALGNLSFQNYEAVAGGRHSKNNIHVQCTLYTLGGHLYWLGYFVLQKLEIHLFHFNMFKLDAVSLFRSNQERIYTRSVAECRLCWFPQELDMMRYKEAYIPLVWFVNIFICFWLSVFANSMFSPELRIIPLYFISKWAFKSRLHSVSNLV